LHQERGKMKASNKLLLLVFAVFFFPGLASAQRPARLVDTSIDLWEAEDAAEWSLDSSGQLILVNSVRGRAHGTGLSSIVVPGGLHALPNSRCLLCGSNSAGHGVVELWQPAGQDMLALVSQRVDASSDYVGVAYDALRSTLYLLDASGARILSGPWDGLSSLGSVQLVTAANAAQVPPLARAQDRTLILQPDGALGLLGWPMVGQRTGDVVNLLGPTPVVSPLGAAPVGHGAYAMPEHSSEGGQLVWVKALEGLVFEVVRLSTSQVIGVGVGQGVTNPVAVTTSEALILGERYAARVQGAATPAQYSFECVRRYGVSEPLSDGTLIRPFFYQLGATSGSGFNIQLLLESTAKPFDSLYSGYLLVAFRAPADPVIQLGQNYLLNPAFHLPVQAWVPARLTQGAFAVDVPIPSGLAGLVFLVQYIVVDGSEFRTSQIYGSAIK
jgi:hypothetical protein